MSEDAVEIVEVKPSFLPASYTNALQHGDQWDEKKVLFLRHFRRTGNVSQSCRLTKIERQTAYKWRDLDSLFARDWQVAREEAIERLEEEARRRAVTGYLEPIYFQGKKCGVVRKYSDPLLTLLLRAHHPEFKEKLEVTAKRGEEDIADRIERSRAIDLSQLPTQQREALNKIAAKLLLEEDGDGEPGAE